MPTLSTERGRSALAVSIVFTCLATFLTAARVYTRACIVKQIGADDYTLLVALAFSWGFFGLFVGETYHGMGAHFVDIPHGIFVTQMLCFWASIPIYQGSLICTKLSILLQYRRVFSSARNMRLACNLLFGFLAVYGTWTFLSAWLTCVPVVKFWDETVPGFCFDKGALWFSNSGIHIFTDLLILIYPMPALKTLQLPKRQKLALMGVFALGGFVMITSCLRLHSLLVVSNSKDQTHDNVGAAEWSAIECNVAIICACLPSTRALLSKLLPHMFSSSNGYRSKTSRFGGATTSAHMHVQSTVHAGRESGPDYDMDDISFSGSNESNSKQGQAASDLSSGIKVTTLVKQESVSQSAHDESTQDLLHKGSL